MQNYRKDYGTIKWTNDTGATVSSDEVVDLGNRIGVAVADISNGDKGTLYVSGQFKLAKDTSTISDDEDVFWNTSTSKITTTQPAGDPRAGLSAESAATGDSYVLIDINAVRTAGGDSTVDSGDGTASQNQSAIATIIQELEEAGIVAKR